jgi:biopolymer transport protein ExbB/TolQ
MFTAVAGLAVHRLAPDGTWLHEFFFNRRFVQWVLIFVFSVGFLSVILRLPELIRNLAFAAVDPLGKSSEEALSAPPRWRPVLEARSIKTKTELNLYLNVLKEREAAEVDAGYRIPTDIAQLLPLIGFFGTVFGLSIGLYNTFLIQGDSSTRAFATAIAIAFDNTLRCLALTIILFAFTSAVRKADESVSAQIADAGNKLLQDLCFSPEAPPADTDEIMRAAASLRAACAELAKSLPAVTDQVTKLKDTIAHATQSLTNFLQHQDIAATAIAGLDEDVKALGEKQIKVQEAIADIPPAIERVHAQSLATSIQHQDATAAMASLNADIRAAIKNRIQIQGAIANFPSTFERVHAQALNSLGGALEARHNELLDAVTAASRQRRRIVLTEDSIADDPPPESRK